MSLLEQAARELAGELGDATPAPDAEGAYVFELADDIRLELHPDAANPDGFVLAAGFDEPAPANAAEDEKRAADFLRFRLARLRAAPEFDAARTPAGAPVLFTRRSPEDARDLREAVGALLEETDLWREMRVNDPAGKPAPAYASGFGLGGLPFAFPAGSLRP